VLVLSRKPGQKIILSNGVVIMLVATNTCTAKIGIDAPADVRVLREELCGERPNTTRIPLVP